MNRCQQSYLLSSINISSATEVTRALLRASGCCPSSNKLARIQLLPHVWAKFKRPLEDCLRITTKSYVSRIVCFRFLTSIQVQEVASRGLVLLFELGDQNIQQTLVNDLVSTLSGGQQGFKVDQGSQIWGVTQEGSGLTTYKELASLATDMNQPDLVYKFLNLASHHALWNSKKGAAFAAKTLATKAESQLKPYLPKLIPKLYRSQYDPNQKIASAMSNILNALVDSKKVGKYTVTRASYEPS
jgi:hypothetical protein